MAVDITSCCILGYGNLILVLIVNAVYISSSYHCPQRLKALRCLSLMSVVPQSFKSFPLLFPSRRGHRCLQRWWRTTGTLARWGPSSTRGLSSVWLSGELTFMRTPLRNCLPIMVNLSKIVNGKMTPIFLFILFIDVWRLMYGWMEDDLFFPSFLSLVTPGFLGCSPQFVIYRF